MKYLTGVYLTDEIARNGTKFGIKALEQAIWQSSIEGRPSHLDHDIHRLVAWSRTQSLFIEPSIARVLGLSYVPENSEEFDIFKKSQQLFFEQSKNNFLKPYLSNFSKLLEDNRLLNNGFFSANGIAYYEKQNIVCEKYPFLCDSVYKDGDGLFYLEKILSHFRYVGQGIFKDLKSDFAICLHPYFRRSYSSYNCFNLDFIDTLLENKSSDINIRLKFDLNRLCFFPSLKQQLEYDYWYGPNYNDDIESIPNGVTNYQTDSTERFFTQSLKTEFWWKSNNEQRDGKDVKLRELEMEEVKDAECKIIGDDHFLCKYIHSVYNTIDDSFEHFDGAIRDYDLEKILFRIDNPINSCPKNTIYTKVFRLDGKIPLKLWKTLITMFYRENSSVYEYFGVKKEREQCGVNQDNSDIRKYVPYILSDGDGIHLNIAYFRKEELKESFTIGSHDVITYGNKKTNAIDADTIDIVKELKKNGCMCTLPNDVAFYSCEDRYHCMPMIKIGGDDLNNNLAKLITVIKTITSKQVANGDNKVYSYTISWCMEDKNIVLSFAAHIKDLNQWLSTINTIPTDHQSFSNWLEKQYHYIQKEILPSTLPLNCVLLDGMIFFDRRNIQEDVNCQIYEQDGKLMTSLEIPKENEDIIDYIQKNSLKIVPLWIIQKMIDDEGVDYLKSTKSTMKGETVVTVIEGQFAWSCWTDK